jgi:adenine deaminase
MIKPRFSALTIKPRFNPLTIKATVLPADAHKRVKSSSSTPSVWQTIALNSQSTTTVIEDRLNIAYDNFQIHSIVNSYSHVPISRFPLKIICI